MKNEQEIKKPDEAGLITDQVRENLESITDKKKKKTPGMHTFAEDIARTAQDKKMSVIKIALAEQKRREDFKKKQQKVKNTNLFFVFLSIFFIVGGVLVAAFFFTKADTDVPLVDSLTSTPGSFIFAETQKNVKMDSLTRAEIINLLNPLRAENTEGMVTNIIFTEGSSRSRAKLSKFLNLVSPNIDSFVSTYFDPLFMYGVYTGDSPQGFLMLHTENIPDAMAALRTWESFMLEDLKPILGINTEGLPNTIFSKDFESEFLFNKESRIVRDDSGNFVFAYVAISRNVIVISGDKDAISETIKRFENQSIR